MSNINYRAILPEGWERPRGFAHAVVATGGAAVTSFGDNATNGSFSPTQTITLK